MTKDDDHSVGIPALLERAQRLGPRLGQAADQLNASIETAEKNLASLKLGVNACVVLSTDETGEWEQLAFDKYGDAWRLLIERGDAYRDDCTVSLLSTASRRTRREAVALLPQLLAALIDNAEAEIVDVEKAARDVNLFSAFVRAAGEKGGK